ncbi:multicopper oxidase domain-containing protein [Sulfuriflexus sp.]|uniref:multicopper oxidase domain-containing protein n=1 Tax=Sulfuriflexus sp. TaxID=2015443 RepID=UPI0028CBF11A|nr:multicopper oxidase domain-containing protein [Sulfuriflexus sp.]MDT8403429.1 multicopper oxidase domain-containing protein [Sulfuriflexus sp.]
MKTLNYTLCVLGFILSGHVYADTINVEMTVKELQLQIDNAGNKQSMWTFGGTIPGPLVRVKQGDVVDFTLHNDKSNKQSHSMDFHAAQVDVLNEFAPVKPGKTRKFQFRADVPGVFIYHCGSEAMSEHIARGMYGVIIVDPREGYSEAYPKPDREYVIVQGDLFKEGTKPKDITMGKGWKAALINGKVYHYDPVHDTNASIALESKPGERVRVYFVNASINESAAFHPIAGIWERVWDNGNPKNVLYGMQTVDVAPAHGMVFDLVSPADRATNNALVDHRMKKALNGAITVLMNHKDADPAKGRNGNLILR